VPVAGRVAERGIEPPPDHEVNPPTLQALLSLSRSFGSLVNWPPPM
jgi:hypothetical protein